MIKTNVCPNCGGSSWTGNIQCNHCLTVLDQGDGFYYETSVGEFAIRINGQIEGWASDEQTARTQYIEKLRMTKKHMTRNRSNLGDQSPSALMAGTAFPLAYILEKLSDPDDIPWDGDPGTYRETGTPQDLGLDRW